MFWLPMIVSAAFAASHAPVPESKTSREQVQRAVERSLVFVEKSGNDWWTSNKCASCHHVPISIWSLSEAKARGFAIKDQTLDQLRNGAVASYTDHPKMRPVGQDGAESKTLISLNVMYLTWAVASAGELDQKMVEAVKKFSDYMLSLQREDGSWASTSTLPPVGDAAEVRTMQVLLALAAAREKGVVDAARWESARDRALGWLSKHKFIDQNQSWNLRLLVAQRFGKAEEKQKLVDELLRQQNADGGWSQTASGPTEAPKEYDEKEAAAPAKPKDMPPAPAKAATAPAKVENRPSDAMATGQTLYALAKAGFDSQHPAVQRALSYLVRTQTKDGSWRVPIRSQKNSGTALSHYGTGWAALGLMQTLPSR